MRFYNDQFKRDFLQAYAFGIDSMEILTEQDELGTVLTFTVHDQLVGQYEYLDNDEAMEDSATAQEIQLNGFGPV